MLARCLADTGRDVIAIDCYGDADTREIAQDHYRVSSLALADILRAVMALKKRHDLHYVIYGSGFEKHLHSLAFLQTQFRLLGNSLSVFSAVQDKRHFFHQLDELAIEYPPVSFDPPASGEHWLAKPLAGEGGLDIRPYRPGSIAGVESMYWQHYIDGMAMSVLFVAVKDRVAIVGFQRQLFRRDPLHPFLFAGVVSCQDLPAAPRSLLAGWTGKIAQRFGLQGLNSLDFILRKGRCYVLELNARPPASLQLYGAGIIGTHLAAVLAGEINTIQSPVDCSAYRIIYAEKEILIGAEIDWPSWSADRPMPGSRIGQGEPVCSIIARAKIRSRLMDRLRSQRQVIEKILYTGS